MKFHLEKREKSEVMQNSQCAPNFFLSWKVQSAGSGRKEQKDSTKVFYATLFDLFYLHAYDCLNLLHGPGYQVARNVLKLYLQVPLGKFQVHFLKQN